MSTFAACDVGCPECGAGPGKRCRGGKNHARRVDHARLVNERVTENYWVRRRVEVRGGPPRTPKPCGTRAAAQRHLRHGEDLDPACDAANKTWERERSLARRRRKRSAA